MDEATMNTGGTPEAPHLAVVGVDYVTRMGRQVAARDATIAYLRAELHRFGATKRVVVKDHQSHQRETPTGKRSALTREREDSKLCFFRDRKSSGLRQELLNSGRTIRRLQDSLDLERQSHRAAIARAWKFEETQRSRFFEYYGRELKREREYHGSMMAVRNGEADRLMDSFISLLGGAAGDETLPVAPPPRPDPEDSAFVQARATVDTTQPSAVLALTSVRVVGDARLPHGLDVLGLISNFLLSPDIPIDWAVSRGAFHISAWLFANGAQPTARTAHVAINTGSLAMVQLVFQNLPAPLSPNVFTDLPLGDHHAAIAEWLVRQYPTHMAHEFARLAASQHPDPRSQWTSYVDRMRRQWEWEDAFDEECWQRKRARLRREQGTEIDTPGEHV